MLASNELRDDSQLGQWHQCRFGVQWVLAIARELFRSQGRDRLAQQPVGKADFSDVVQKRCDIDIVAEPLVECQMRAHSTCKNRDPSRVAGHTVVTQLHQAGKDLHRQHEVGLQLVIGDVEHVVDLADFGCPLAHPILESAVQHTEFFVSPLNDFRELSVLELELTTRQRLAHDEQDVVVVPRLGDVAMDFATVDGGDGRADIRVAGQ